MGFWLVDQFFVTRACDDMFILMLTGVCMLQD